MLKYRMIYLDKMYVKSKLILYIILIILFFHQVSNGQDKNRLNIRTIVLDAGHGGKDPGTVVGKAREKDIVLDIALKLGKLLRQNKSTIKVIFTRDGDYFIPLMDRAKIANKSAVDLFISIHANYCETPAINGTETYVLGLHRTEDNLNVAKKENSVILLEEDYTKRYEGFNPNLSESYIMFELLQDTHLDQSVRFAAILQSNFKQKAQRNDREVRQAGFLVLRETAMPSVLIETGYLSNKKENSYLLSDEGRAEIAESIYRSILNYINKLDSRGTVSSTSDNTEIIAAQHLEERKSLDTSANQITKKVVRKTEIKTPPSKKERTESKKPAENLSDQKGKTYAIQIIVLNHRKPISSKIFKGLKPLREIFILNQYKYYSSESDNLNTVVKHLKSVKQLFPDAFIVSITGNEPKRLKSVDIK